MPVWIVYRVDRLIVGVFDTAENAAAWVNDGTGLTATAGLTSAAALAAQPGQYYLTDGTIAYDLPIPALDLLKQAAWAAHAHLRHVWEQIQIEGAAHPWSELIKVHDYLAKVHPSLYTIVKTNTSTIRSFAERTAICAAIPNGPQDGSGNVLSIGALFQAISVATAVGTQQGVIYVNPNDYTHVSIADSLVTNTRSTWGLGTLPGSPLVVTEQELASGDWIPTIT